MSMLPSFRVCVVGPPWSAFYIGTSRRGSGHATKVGCVFVVLLVPSADASAAAVASAADASAAAVASAADGWCAGGRADGVSFVAG